VNKTEIFGKVARQSNKYKIQRLHNTN